MAKKRATTGKDQLHLEVPDENDVGIDPHKKTLTASILDRRGGTVATETFKVSGVGHRALEDWASGFGPVRRWGIEGASSLGRHTAVFLIERGHDVRDVCPTMVGSSELRSEPSDGLMEVFSTFRGYGAVIDEVADHFVVALRHQIRAG